MDDPRLLREQLVYQLYLAAKPRKEFLDWFMKRVAEGDLGEEAREAYERGYRIGLEETRNRIADTDALHAILDELALENGSKEDYQTP